MKSSQKIAVLGGDTLLGKELGEILNSRMPGVSVVQFAASGAGSFGETEGEAIYLEALDANTLRGTMAVLLAGSAPGAEKAYELARSAGGKPVIIDCSGFLEHLPEARLVAPLLQDIHVRKAWLFAIAHPAANALALLLRRLTRYRTLRRLVVNIFEPASESGKKGVMELQQQTANLLSFKPLEKTVFDAQQTFNLLPRYGEEASVKLAATEARIERHLATILSDETSTHKIPIPSLRLVGAPVFHGYSFSIWAEFDGSVSAQEIGEALASAQIEVRSGEEEAPDNVGVASQSGLIAGDIRVDSNNPNAAWLWVVADNLRLMADSAADLVQALAEASA